MIIDAHVHIEHESPSAIYEMEKRAGVDRAVCWSIWNDSHESNLLTKAAAEAYPDFFIPWGHVRSTDPQWREELSTISETYRWTGLKLHFGEFRNRDIQTLEDFRALSDKDLPQKQGLFEIMHAAQERGLPVIIDPSGLYHVMEEIAHTFTRCPVIIAHLGANQDYLGSFCGLAKTLAHVYLDVSFVHVYRHIQTAYELVGSEKLIWGSDSYWMEPSVELAKLSVVRFASEADRENMLWRNIAQILALPEA